MTQQQSSTRAVHEAMPSLRILPAGGFLMRSLSNIHRQHRDIVRLKLGVADFYLMVRPELIQEVLITKQRSFVKGEYLQRTKKVFGEGLLTSEGDFHHRQRRLVLPAFHHDRINAYAGIMSDRTEDMIGRWQDGQILDVHREMMRLTMPIVAKCLFDTDVESQSGRIAEDLTTTIKYFDRLSSPLSRILQRLPTNRKYEKAVERIDALVHQLIETRRQTAGDAGDLMSILLQARDEEGLTMTDDQIRDEVLILFAAGHETTANALTWTWYLLSENPAVNAKLQTELDDVVPTDISISAEVVPRLVYTRKVLTESMRLYPPAWILVRKALEDSCLGNYVVPAGANILISQYVNHHDPRFFPDPELFDPDRWTPKMREELPRFAYFPFGGGARSCIGEPFAWMEGILLLAAIARRWRMRHVRDHKVEMLPRITLRPRYGMKMKLRKR